MALYENGVNVSSGLPAHVVASDPHTGYRLESADHTHASTGAQAGTLGNAALAGVAYTQFTPGVTQGGAVTSFTTNSCWAAQLGKLVHAYGTLVINNAGAAAGGSAIVIASLPVNAANRTGAAGEAIGHGTLIDVSATPDDSFAFIVRQNAAGSFFLEGTGEGHDVGGLGVIGFTAGLATGDIITFNLLYEAA